MSSLPTLALKWPYNQSINLYQIQVDPDTGRENKFHTPMDIECANIRAIFQLIIGTIQGKHKKYVA
jgi:hypothetical protein